MFYEFWIVYCLLLFFCEKVVVPAFFGLILKWKSRSKQTCFISGPNQKKAGITIFSQENNNNH